MQGRTMNAQAISAIHLLSLVGHGLPLSFRSLHDRFPARRHHATATERFCASFVMQVMVFMSLFERRRILQLFGSYDYDF